MYSEKADERGVGFKVGDGSNSKEDCRGGGEREKLKFGRPKSVFRGEGVVLEKSGRRDG